jgi:hypothetical protein
MCAKATDGPVEVATSVPDATNRLANGWVSCNRNRWLLDRDGDGIVIFDNGTWSLLKLDGNGALAPVTGLGTRGTWSLYGSGTSSPLDPTDSQTQDVVVIGFRDDGSSSGMLETARLDFEPDGTRMRLSKPNASPPEESWFASAGTAPAPTSTPAVHDASVSGNDAGF